MAEASLLLKGVVLRNIKFGNFTGCLFFFFFNTLLEASWSFPLGRIPQILFLKLSSAQLIPHDGRNRGPPLQRGEHRWEEAACGVACRDGIYNPGLERR